MSRILKWIGGGIGFISGGPLGALLGYALGALADRLAEEGLPEADETGPQVSDFSAALLVLTAAVMKADGAPKKSELDYVKRFMIQNFGAEKAKRQVLLLREIMKKDFSLRQVCIQIRQGIDHPSRLQMLHYLFGISRADGHVSDQEISVIQLIANYLGISQKDFDSLLAMFKTDSKESPYLVLEVENTASVEEIKKAYRKMAVKHHPDKVAHLGEEVQKQAKEKFQRVQDAYEALRKEKGFK